MRRSSKGWPGLHSDSRTSARVAPRTSRIRAPVILAAVPDHGRRLPDGVLIKGSIVARVLGMRILTLDTNVVVTPAEVSEPSLRAQDTLSHDGRQGGGGAPALAAWQAADGASTRNRVQPSGAAPTRNRLQPRGGAPGRSRAVNHGLAEAVRRIDEGAALLALSRNEAP